LALAFVIEMGVAIWKVHFKNGLMGNGGYEFPLAVAAIAFGAALFWRGAVGSDVGQVWRAESRPLRI
jgi:hypothetical protein